MYFSDVDVRRQRCCKWKISLPPGYIDAEAVEPKTVHQMSSVKKNNQKSDVLEKIHEI